MFVLTIETGNAAFEDDPLAEVARLLAVAASLCEGGTSDGLLLDINGNAVGTFGMEG